MLKKYRGRSILMAAFSAASLMAQASYGDTKTWNPSSNSEQNWSLGANWTPTAAPTGADDLVIVDPAGTGSYATSHFLFLSSSGTTTLSAQSITFNSALINAVSATDTGSSTRNLQLGSNSSSSSVLTVGSGAANNIYLGGQFSNAGVMQIVLAYSGQRSATIASGKTLVFTGKVVGTGGLILDGEGTAEFGASLVNPAGTASFSGGITVNSGVLSSSSGGGSTTSSPFGTGAITLNGGAVRGTTLLPLLYNNISVTSSSSFSGFEYWGTVSFSGSQTLTIPGETKMRGVISGSGSVVKTGSGVIALGSDNTFSGGFTLSEGALDIGNSSGTGAVPVTSGPVGTGTLTINGGTALYANGTPGSGKSIGNNVVINGSFTFGDGLPPGTGYNTNNSSANLIINGSVTLGADATITVGTGRYFVPAAAVTGAYTLTKDGPGVLQFRGPSTTKSFTAMVANAGTVDLFASGLFTSANPVDFTIASGASLTYTGSAGSNTLGKLSGGGSVSLPSSYTLNTGGSGSATFSGVVSGSGILGKVGSSTQTYSGTIANAGGMVVSAGTVTVNGTFSSAFTGPTSVAPGAALNLNTAYPSTAGALSFSGSGGTITSTVTQSWAARSITVPSGAALNVGVVTGTNNATAATIGTLSVSGSVTVAPRATSGDNRTEKAAVLVVSSLSVTGSSGAYTGTINLMNNDMIVRGGNLTTVRGMVASWWNSGLRNGLGITAASGTGYTELATLGVMKTSAFSTFDGVSINSSDVLIKYTYIGDTDFDGDVDDADMDNLIAGMNGSLTGWENGDNNYDGVVDGTDLANLMTVSHLQGTPLSRNAPGSTPPLGDFPTLEELLAGAPIPTFNWTPDPLGDSFNEPLQLGGVSSVPEAGSAGLLIGVAGLALRRQRGTVR